MEFLVLHYRADSDKVIKGIEVVKADGIEAALEEVENNFTCSIAIPKNRENKREVARLLEAFG